MIDITLMRQQNQSCLELCFTSSKWELDEYSYNMDIPVRSNIYIVNLF